MILDLLREPSSPLVLLALGAAVTLAGLGTFFTRAWLEARRARLDSSASRPAGQSRARWLTAFCLIAIVAAGAALRWDRLDRKSISHPEIYVPGINLPDGISEPPPRLTWSEVVWWHFHDEPHPQAYYFLMFLWTQRFGTSLYSIRLPSVLFGIGCIVLMFLVAASTHGRLVGLLAAALLAFNGFAIYWSQLARMYAMACFLGLLSTLLLMRLAGARRPQPLGEALYVLVSLLGMWTEILFWPFLAAHMLWTMVLKWRPGGAPPRIVWLQVIAIVLGAALIGHAIYRARPAPLEAPTLMFLQHYLSFGFLLKPDPTALSQPSPTVGLLLLLLAATCLRAGLRDPGRRFPLDSAGREVRRSDLWPIVAGSVLLVLALAELAMRRQEYMALVAVVPVVAMSLPAALSSVWRCVSAAGERVAWPGGLREVWRSPYVWLAFVPALAVFAISYRSPLLAPRLFLLYVPYLIIIAAIGLKRLARPSWSGVAIVLLVAFAHVASVQHYRRLPSSPMNYANVARAIAARYYPDDLIFVQERHWFLTPIFYYLDAERYTFVTRAFAEAVRAHPRARIWIIDPGIREMEAALGGFELTERIGVGRATIRLYTRGHP